MDFETHQAAATAQTALKDQAVDVHFARLSMEKVGECDVLPTTVLAGRDKVSFLLFVCMCVHCLKVDIVS